MGARILIIDDEVQIRRLLRVTLHANGYVTLESPSGEEGVVRTGVDRPDLVILDLGLPDMEGVEVLRQIREWSNVPVIVLTVREDEAGKVSALDAGADDYITKPFGMQELMARIRVALRHSAKTQDEPVLDLGRLVIDLANRIVKVDDEPIKLTPIEYELLKILAMNAGRVMTHRQLLRQVWGDQSYDSGHHYLRVYVGHLRKKVEEDPTRPKVIITEPGVGYRLLDTNQD